MTKRLTLILFSLLALGCQDDQVASSSEKILNKQNTSQLRATTFNLKWYGMKRKGGYEFRNPYLKKFITQELGDSDIILFTEVVTPELLDKVVGHKMHCQGDEFPDGYSNQQRNVLCYDKSKFRIEAYDHDFIIPEVAMKKPGQTKTGLRPALHLQLCHLQGSCFLQVIGLHLKAGPSWHRRASQIAFVRDELEKQSFPLPTLILGDMNSYRKERKSCGNICIDSEADPATCEIDEEKKFECSEDDITVFNDILKQAHGRTYRSVTLDQKTYGTGPRARDYDHLILTSDIQARDVETYISCGESVSPQSIHIPYHSTYKKYISDHCPVSATLTVTNSTL